VLAVRGDHLVQVPHPDVATLRTGVLGRLDGTGGLGPLPPFLDLELDVIGPALLELRAGRPVLAVAADGAGAVRLDVPGEDPVELGGGPGADDRRVRVLVDGGLVEVATAGEAAALRVPVTGPLEVVLRGPGRVVVHGMPGAG
jgi:hypothetical protein